MPNYSRSGKILVPISPGEFREGMVKGRFVDPKHIGLVALVYYTGVRISEALRSIPKQFWISVENELCYDVLARLKHGQHTPVLNLPLEQAYVQNIAQAVEDTRELKRIWPYCRKTGYNIIERVFHYPHHLRLSRITNFFLQGYTIPEVRSWTGLSLTALNYYVGLAKVKKMGKALE